MSEPASTRDLLLDTAERGANYLAGVRHRSLTPSLSDLAALPLLGDQLPENGQPAEEVIALLDKIGSPATVATAGGRYFGLVIGGALPVTVAANWLAGAWDQNAVFRWTSPVSAKLEDLSLQWIGELFGLPEGFGGNLVSGASAANLTVLAAARHALLARAGWDVEAKGLNGAPPLRVVVGEEVHVSVLKALAILGLGRETVLRVPVDEQGRIRPDALPPLDGRTILCIQAGNVNTGAFDPARELCAAAQRAGAWVHVDGAFGLWALASPDLRHLAAGFSQADSWATDGHKWLNVPYDCGLAFVREPAHLRAAMAMNAAYLLEAREVAREPSHYTLEMSRRARGVEVWAALRHLGRTGIAEMIERNCRQAARMASSLAAAGFDVLNDVQLNQVLVSFGSPEMTRDVIDRLQRDGTCWCGGTVWQGRTAMRISVSSWATSDRDVDLSVAAMIRISAEARGDHLASRSHDKAEVH